MTTVDFILVAGAAFAAGYAVRDHLAGAAPAKVTSFFTTLKQEIKSMLIDALNDLKAAADADKAKAVAEAEAKAQEAANTQAAADEQAVRDFTAQNFPATGA